MNSDSFEKLIYFDGMMKMYMTAIFYNLLTSIYFLEPQIYVAAHHQITASNENVEISINLCKLTFWVLSDVLIEWFYVKYMSRHSVLQNLKRYM